MFDESIQSPPTKTVRKPKLAVISTYDELCGIAAYTRFLVKQLEEEFEVKVFDLDQYLLRNPHRNVRKLGDAHIREITRQFKDFDWVNIQMEHGTLGRSVKDIFRRFKWLISAAPRVSITFHTVLEPTPFNWGGLWKELFSIRPWRAKDFVVDHFRNNAMANGIYRLMRRVQLFKPLSVIVHNRRDMRLMKYVNRFKRVFDHPLSFQYPQDVAETRERTTRAHYPLLGNVPADAKLIGVFGFFGTYKGFDTVVRAMHHLPQDYHLLLFGGVHPNEVKLRQPLDPYIETLLDEAFINTTIMETKAAKSVSMTLALNETTRDLLVRHPKDLSGRIHFMGALTDSQFTSGMAICDTVVLPYLEVGQSSSGPMSLAMEMNCRVIASRTLAFMQYARYYPETIEFFDIGNFVDLAERLQSEPTYPPAQRNMSYNVKTNIQTYLRAHTLERKGETDAVTASVLTPKEVVSGSVREIV